VHGRPRERPKDQDVDRALQESECRLRHCVLAGVASHDEYLIM
jgi:hypothetical protein